MKYGTAYFACGCFWGVQHYMGAAAGVIDSRVGYMGGTEENPDYRQVKAHSTGHAEVVEICYTPRLTTYEKLCKLFFEIHDPAQVGGIGTDTGPQYRSELFYVSQRQKETAQRLIRELRSKGYTVNTRLTAASRFWIGEEYHQHYFEKNGGTPDCHFRIKKFD